jgi:hypothetical protein
VLDVIRDLLTRCHTSLELIVQESVAEKQQQRKDLNTVSYEEVNMMIKGLLSLLL